MGRQESSLIFIYHWHYFTYNRAPTRCDGEESEEKITSIPIPQVVDSYYSSSGRVDRKNCCRQEYDDSERFFSLIIGPAG